LEIARTRSAGARDWAQVLARYREPDLARSTFELLLTACCFVVLWFLTWAALGLGYWASLLVAVPTAGFLVRFVHDPARLRTWLLLSPPRCQ